MSIKVVIAPQEFKGSVSAVKVSEAISKGVKKVFPDAVITIIPVADGGDGTLNTLVESTRGKKISSDVTGPLGEIISAEWGALGDGNTAVIEMAKIAGLTLVPEIDRNPLLTTTYGLGEIVKDALDKNFRKFIIGIGGSATNDAGAGMAQALGVRLLDSFGENISFGGSGLIDLQKIEMSERDPRVNESQFLVACDVNNPLTGEQGAAAVYGPQKGATSEMVKTLDDALYHFSKVVSRDIGKEINDLPGSGAAGGLGGGIVGLLDGQLLPGSKIILDMLGIEKKIIDSDLVITGEGQTDFQTVFDKAPISVSKIAKSLSIPCIAISGSLGEGFESVYDEGIGSISSILNKPMNFEEAIIHSEDLITSATEQAMKYLKIGNKLNLN